MVDDGGEDTSHTTELALSDIRQRLPSAPDDLRSFLPGLEPERRVTDWGRSERVEAFVDRTLYDFLYRYWFRVEVEGVDHVPDTGGALLVANHAGAVPPDGAMIVKAIRQEHGLARPVHVAIDHSYSALPGIGMLAAKVGAVSAHPANVHRLLFDEGQLVLVFPEGRSARHKGFRDRYRLRRFGTGEYVQAAMRARVPIIPVAVLGAEEAQPVFARVGLLSALLRLPRVPITSPLPLPAKFRIRFLEPIDAELRGEQPWRDQGLVQTLSQDIRALIQENVLELVAQRRSVWLG